MTNERSDELRRKHGHWSPHRDHHPVGSIADAGLDVIECLDALDAMTAECDRLRSGLEVRAVVVPECAAWLTIDEMEEVIQNVVLRLPVKGTGMPRYIASKIAEASLAKGTRANQGGAAT